MRNMAIALRVMNAFTLIQKKGELNALIIDEDSASLALPVPANTLDVLHVNSISRAFAQRVPNVP